VTKSSSSPENSGRSSKIYSHPLGEDVPKAASSHGLHKSFIQLAWSAADNHDITHRAHAHAPCTSAASSPISGTSWPARLGFVFQPIFDLRRREVLGYKTLMRGPTDSPLHTPEQLLRVARDAGLGLPLERLAARRAVATFVAAGLPGRLFINLSGAMIVDVSGDDELPRMLDEGGLDTARLVVEYMDTDTPAGLEDAWQKLRAQGCGRATGRAGWGRISSNCPCHAPTASMPTPCAGQGCRHD
jgi:EAL domain-containing protein (putative c-di-GMP-specific phosphodiesterase class I)